MKKIVVPGELVSEESKKMQGGVYKKEGKIYAQHLGVLYDNDIGVKVVPLDGKYMPRISDVIVGRVIQDDPFVYVLDVNSHTRTVLPKRNMDGFLNVNDVVLLRVTSVNEIKDFDVELISKLFKGNLLEISPKKIARVIGKSKSMLSVLEKYTKTRITVGANGYVYAVGENIKLLEEALAKIETYSHVDDLTVKMENYLKNVSK